MAGENQRQRIGALEAREGRRGCLLGGHAALQVEVDQLSHGFGVGLGREFLTFGLELGAEGSVVLDDAVMDDGHARGAVRVGVALRRRAVGGPARVADAGEAGERVVLKRFGQVDQLAAGAPALDVAVDERGDAGAVIAAVFEAAQRVQQPRGCVCLTDNADYAAHARLHR